MATGNQSRAGSFRATGGGGAGTGTALSARGTWTGRAARRRPAKRPRPAFLSFQRPAGRRRPSNRFSQHVFALQETVEPGACGPDQHPVQDASDSGRTSVTSACAPPRETQLQRLSGLQAGGIAQDASLRVAGNRISPRQRIAWIQRARAPAAASRLRACRRSRAWAWPSCRAAFATRSPRARVGLAMFGVARARRRALRACGADRGRQPEARLFRRSR